jgi:ABC-type nitrate/sulfonate/bicarbonate transport system substrate-binding protein
MNILLKVFLCVFGLLVGSSDVHSSSAPTKVVFAYPTMIARTTFIWIAQEQGFFVKNGIDAELILMSRGPVLVAALSAGDVQVGNTGGAPALGAAAGGADFKVVASFNSRWVNNLVTAPDIHSPKDLRGKRFGLSSLGGTMWMGAMLWLEHLGLEPSKDDIRFVVIGNQSLLAQALEKGNIDVAQLDAAMSLRMEKKGFSVLADSSRVKLPIPSQGIVVRGDYLQKQPRVVEGVLRALIEGLAFTVAPTNKPIVLKTMMKHLRISEPAAAEEGYQEILTSLDRKPYPSLDGLKNIQRLGKIRDPRLAGLRLENLVDDSFVRKLDESGFIDRIYVSYGVR